MRVLSHSEICLLHWMIEDHLCHWQRGKTNYLHEAANRSQPWSSRFTMNSWMISAPGRVLWERFDTEKRQCSCMTGVMLDQLAGSNLTLHPTWSGMGISLGSLGKRFQVRCQRAVLGGVVFHWQRIMLFTCKNHGSRRKHRNRTLLAVESQQKST